MFLILNLPPSTAVLGQRRQVYMVQGPQVEFGDRHIALSSP